MLMPLKEMYTVCFHCWVKGEISNSCGETKPAPPSCLNKATRKQEKQEAVTGETNTQLSRDRQWVVNSLQ